MRFTRTVRVPLHYGTDVIKLKRLDKFTARLSFCVSVFLDIIRTSGIVTKGGLSEFEGDVQKHTGLSAGFVQQCRDKAFWMWKSYLKLHKLWERKVKSCGDRKYLEKVKKREPSMPSANGKVPIRLDSRTINLVTDMKFGGKLVRPLKKDLNLSNFWLNLSTLVKYDKVMLPLRLSNYHLKKLKNCKRIIDCEIVKKGKKYYANLACEYFVKDVDVQFFKTVDLGILRSLSTVLFDAEGNMVRNSFKILRDNQMKAKLKEIDEKIKLLQREENWKYLKKVRTYRRNFVDDYMRKSSKEFAEHCVNCKVFVGYPKGIKYRHFKGDGNRRHRKRLGKWSYKKQISYIQQACEALGVKVEVVNESYTSKKCSNCKSSNTKWPFRNNFSLFHCNDCHKTYNADFNSSVNIGKKFVASQCFARNGCDLKRQVIKLTAPKCADDSAQKLMSAQPLQKAY